MAILMFGLLQKMMLYFCQEKPSVAFIGRQGCGTDKLHMGKSLGEEHTDNLETE